MTRRVLLLRHTAVAAGWRGRCYGERDVPLGAEGRRTAKELALDPSLDAFVRVVSSPLRRARWLGGLIARRRGVALEIEPRLAERGFGWWEGRDWDGIWAVEGNAMDGILDAPATYRPGGGETTDELGRRAAGWFHSLPVGASLLAVAHGGPVGALVGTLRGEAPRDWLAHVPRPGEGVLITMDADGAPRCRPWGQAGGPLRGA